MSTSNTKTQVAFRHLGFRIPLRRNVIFCGPSTEERYWFRRNFKSIMDNIEKYEFLDKVNASEESFSNAIAGSNAFGMNLLDQKKLFQSMHEYDWKIIQNYHSTNLFFLAYYNASKSISKEGWLMIPPAKIVFEHFSKLLWKAKLLGLDIGEYESYLLPYPKKKK